jgi:RNA polymerase sigma-70 factor (ECF subfamily)
VSPSPTTRGAPRRSEAERRFESVYRENAPRVSSYLLARTDRDSAETALGRTFEIAWRRHEAVPKEPLPWLLAVARRVLAEQRRASGRRDALIERISEGAHLHSEDHSEAVAQRQLLLTAIGRLTPAQQETVTLIAWEGLSEAEVATAMGCSRGAVALRLHRARRQLRRAIQQRHPEQQTAPSAPRQPQPSTHASPGERT